MLVLSKMLLLFFLNLLLLRTFIVYLSIHIVIIYFWFDGPTMVGERDT